MGGGKICRREIESVMTRLRERNGGDTGEHKHRVKVTSNQTFHSIKTVFVLLQFAIL